MMTFFSTLASVIGYLFLGVATSLWLVYRAGRRQGESDLLDAVLFSYYTMVAFVFAILFLGLGLYLDPEPQGLALFIQRIAAW